MKQVQKWVLLLEDFYNRLNFSSEYMPVTHGVTGSSPVRTALSK